MQSEKTKLLQKLRRYLFKQGLKNASVENLKKNGVHVKDVFKYFGSIENMIDKLLENERIAFEEIFHRYNFDGMNAIDILLIVSKEINDRFYNVSPFITTELKKRFPEIYKEHIDNRLEFVYDKIQINISKGIAQGIYRNDISIEMIARMYITQLKDMHYLETYDPKASSFATVFNTLINNFIEGIATKQGKKYYRHRKQLFGVLSFGH